MKKRVLMWILLALVSTRGLAEGGVYIGGDSYHATPLCVELGGDRDDVEHLLSLAGEGGDSGGAAEIILENRYPTLAESEALDWGFLPCPVCVGDDTDSDLHAVQRGGTVVLRMPDGWIQSRKLFKVWSATERSFTGDEAQKQLAEYIHGDAYAAFWEAAALNGEAEASVEALKPNLKGEDIELIMSVRHIGGAWLLAAHMNDQTWERMKRDGALELGVRLEGGPMRWRDGALIWEDWGLRFEESRTLALETIDGAPVFSGDFENLSLTLFREMDANILVVRESPGAADWLEGAELTLDDTPSADGLTGYMDGDDAVYVCTLTDIEANALKSGAFPRLLHPGRVTRPVAEDDGWRLADVSEAARSEALYDYTVFFRDGALYITNNADEGCQAVTVYLREQGSDTGPEVRLDAVPLGETLRVYDQNEVLYLGNGGEALCAWASPASGFDGAFISNYDYVWGAWVEDKWLYGHTPIEADADPAVFVDDSGVSHVLQR